MTDVRTYATTAEREILKAFAQHDILVASYGCKQGPQTLTYALRLIQNTLDQRSKALKLAKVIEGAIMDTSVRMRDRSGYIYIEIPSPVAVPVLAPNLRGDGLAVPIGMTPSRNVRGIDFGNSATAHTVIVAATGKGKTTTGRSILFGLARQNDAKDVRIAVATFKPKDWQAFTHLPHLLDLALEPKEIVRILRWANAEVYRRSRAGIDSPRYVILLDDMFNWGKLVDVGDDIAQISSLGRAAGFNLLVLTQRMTAEGLGKASAAVGNITTRVVLGAGSASEAALLTGLSGTGGETLGRYPGDALLVTGGAYVRVACASVSDAAVQDLAKGGKSPGKPLEVPWADVAGGSDNRGMGAPKPADALLRKVGDVPVAGPRTIGATPVTIDAPPRQASPPQAGTAPPAGTPEAPLLLPGPVTSVEPSLEPSLESDSSDVGVSAKVDAKGNAPAAGLSLPLERIDPPTPEQVAVIVQVWNELGGRMTRTIETCYGAKGKRTSDLVHKALESAGIAWGEADE